MKIHSGENYHLGHFFRDCMLNNPDAVCQIDAATGEEETRRSVLTRATILAKCLRALGLRPGDILVIGGSNHLDIHIPYYAALMNGYPASGVDPFFNFDQIKQMFKQLEPKIAFCQQSTYNDYRRALDELGLSTRIVTFDGTEYTMQKLIQQCGVTANDLDDFQVADFDTDKVYAWLVSTSGSTGHPKIAAMSHQSTVTLVKTLPKINANEPARPALNLASVQWVSSFVNAICMPAKNQIKVQSSLPVTAEHVIDIINKYKPVTMMTAPHLVHNILHHEKKCDMSCFDTFLIAGAPVHKKLLVDLRAALRPDASGMVLYGQTECLVAVFEPMSQCPLGSCGIETPLVKVKLVRSTGEVITKPNVTGELWIKGLMFSEYYKNPKKMAEAVTPDGWYKTGDLFRRDQNGFYFFVERLNMLIRFRSYVVVPMELEELIQMHKDVHAVCVTSIRHQIDGELPVAVVVRKPGAAVSAQEIINLVASKLPDYKQLRGGVLFVEEMPMTSTGKIARPTVKQFVNHTQLQ